jgi:hypothetical protein
MVHMFEEQRSNDVYLRTSNLKQKYNSLHLTGGTISPPLSDPSQLLCHPFSNFVSILLGCRNFFKKSSISFKAAPFFANLQQKRVVVGRKDELEHEHEHEHEVELEVVAEFAELERGLGIFEPMTEQISCLLGPRERSVRWH